MSQGHNINAKLRDAGLRGYPTFCYDSVGNITFASGADIPTGAGYAYGCLFVQNDATTPGAGVYVNVGTSTSASFVPQASVAGLMTLSLPVIASQYIAAPSGTWGWVAPIACVISSASFHTQAVGGAGNIMLHKHTAASSLAPGNAFTGSTVTRIINNGTNAGWDAMQSINVAVPGSLTGGAPNTLAAGDKIAIQSTAIQSVTGTLWGLITLGIYPL